MVRVNTAALRTQVVVGRSRWTHFQPRSCGGTDDFSNLLYCCWRCNLYKADYWPTDKLAPALWNPRTEPTASHFVLLADGTLHALTPTGLVTVTRLRLNRTALVEFRGRKLTQESVE